MYQTGLPKLKPLIRLYGYGHVHWIDRDNLIMHLGVIHIAVWKIDVTGVHVEGNDRGIIDNVAGIRDLNVRTIVRVADRPGLESGGRELAARGAGRNAADRARNQLFPR